MRNITILGSNNNSIKMFIDFYRTLYLKGNSPEIITLNSLNSSDVIEGIVRDALNLEATCRVFTVKIKDNFVDQNLPKFLIDNSDMIIRFDRTGLESNLNSSDLSPKLIKLPEQFRHIIDRWDSNIERMSSF